MIEWTVPIEAEATAAPLAITTSAVTPGTPAGVQLSGWSQSELMAPVQVDWLTMRLPYLDRHAMPAEGLAAQTNFTSVPVPLSGARVKSEFV